MVYNSMVKCALMCGSETWSLCEVDRRTINGTEMDVVRRSARVSKLGRKTNGGVRENMNA